MFRKLRIKWEIWNGKALNIHSKGRYPADILSNICSNDFQFEGIICGSMEGFLQSLKQQDPSKQRQICAMKGRKARSMTTSSWQTDQIIWWKGKAIDRQGTEFQQLLRQAFQAMFEQNDRFRTALMQTRGKKLIYTHGKHNPLKTILTAEEFCNILMEIRNRYDARNKSEELKEKSRTPKKLIYLYDQDSSAVSHTIQLLKKEMPELDIEFKEIPKDPQEAISFLRKFYFKDISYTVMSSFNWSPPEKHKEENT